MKKYLIVVITLASTLSAFGMDKVSHKDITKQEPIPSSSEKKEIDNGERVVQTYTSAEDLEEFLNFMQEESEEPGSEEDEEEFCFDPINSSATEDSAKPNSSLKQ